MSNDQRGKKIRTMVRTREDLKPYTGLEACQIITGKLRQEAFLANYHQLKVNYSGAVEFQLRRQLVLLCPQTADFMYRHFTPIRVDYQIGSRPALEALVEEVTDGLEKECEQALSLMRFCRDLYKRNWSRNFDSYVYGGTEEQLIEKGEELCECLGRLFVALCEIAGIPGRIVMHVIGGHIVSEVYLDGGWAYIDPRAGLYFVKPDGQLASTWELWKNPELLRSQDERVRAEVSERFTWEERIWVCEHKYFHPKEVTGFMNYSLADAHRYTYAQTTQQQATEAGLWTINERYRKLTNRIFGLAGRFCYRSGRHR